MYKKLHLDKRQDVATNKNVDTKFSAHDAVSGITFIGNIQRQKVESQLILTIFGSKITQIISNP